MKFAADSEEGDGNGMSEVCSDEKWVITILLVKQMSLHNSKTD